MAVLINQSVCWSNTCRNNKCQETNLKDKVKYKRTDANGIYTEQNIFSIFLCFAFVFAHLSSMSNIPIVMSRTGI